MLTQRPAAQETGDHPAMPALIGLLAYASADVVHHVLGHAGACLALGGRLSSLTSIHVTCTVTGTAVDLAGPLANLLAGVVAAVAARAYRQASSPARLFLALAAAFNLFWFALQLVFSAASRTDDWAWFLRSEPDVVRYVLVGVGAASYLLAMRVLVTELAGFAIPPTRAWRIALAAWIAGGFLACATAAFDPHPAAALVQHAAPQSLLLSLGLLFAPARAARAARAGPSAPQAGAIGFSAAWAAAAMLVAAGSIALLGPGIPF